MVGAKRTLYKNYTISSEYLHSKKCTLKTSLGIIYTSLGGQFL